MNALRALAGPFAYLLLALAGLTWLALDDLNAMYLAWSAQ